MGIDNFEITFVPDTSIMLLLGSSLMGLAIFGRNFKKNQSVLARYLIAGSFGSEFCFLRVV